MLVTAFLIGMFAGLVFLLCVSLAPSKTEPSTGFVAPPDDPRLIDEAAFVSEQNEIERLRSALIVIRRHPNLAKSVASQVLDTKADGE